MKDEIVVLNFAHPLTDMQKEQIETKLTRPITNIITVPTQFDNNEPFEEQVRLLVEQVPFTPEQWQTTSLIVNPPGYTPAALILMAELHGRMGYFPVVIRVRPQPDTVPPVYEIGEIINLQQVRELARKQRR